MTQKDDPQNRLQQTAPQERPAERMLRHGPSALSDAELLALLLRKGTHGHDVMTLAGRLVAEAGSVGGLLSWSEARFRHHRGIGPGKALQLVSAMEIARRAFVQRAGAEPKLDDASGVADYMRPFVAGLEVEKFWVLCLNRKGRLLKRVEVSSGIASSTVVHPREVFRAAITEGASSVICVHNHPSGDPAPSVPDYSITRTLRTAALAVEIDLLDHVVLGTQEQDPRGLGYFSFRLTGHL